MLALQSLLLALSDAYSMVIFVYIMMSWFPIGGGVIGDVYRFLGKLCDPYLDVVRRFLPPSGGMIDVSPIVAVLVLQLATRFVVGLL